MISSRAFAKINLGLRILGKRPDNYHNIETIFTTISLHDEITVTRTEQGISLTCPGTRLPTSRHNLAYCAAALFLEHSRLEAGVSILLQKKIPIGAGLGGGSADAACVLKMLRDLFGLVTSDQELVELGRTLGMDVPFFIRGGAACARGRGDELEHFRLPRLSLVICHPGFSISTKWAYENIGSNLTKEENWITMLRKGLETQDFALVRQYLINDFEPLVFKIYPELGRLKEELLKLGAHGALLSGSGSTLYAIVDETSKPGILQFLKEHRKQYSVAETGSS